MSSSAGGIVAGAAVRALVSDVEKGIATTNAAGDYTFYTYPSAFKAPGTVADGISYSVTWYGPTGSKKVSSETAATEPNTGFGYQELGAEIEPGIERVVRFTEKPSREVAEEFVRAGNYTWNAAMFV